MRFIPADRTSDRRGPSRRCEHPGCNEATRENKPFCSEHIEDSPYLQRLTAQLAAKENEETLVGLRGASEVEEDSETLKEIQNILEITGPRTTLALAKATMLDEKALSGYLNYLKKKGLIKTTRNRRGNTVVKLAHQEFKKNPSWLEERDYHFMEPLDKRIRRLCHSDLTADEISEHLNVPSGFVSEICKSRRPIRNPVCECNADYDEPHFTWCEMSMFR